MSTTQHFQLDFWEGWYPSIDKAAREREKRARRESRSRRGNRVYHIADKEAHNSVEEMVKCWEAGRNRLPAGTAKRLGVETVAGVLWPLRKHMIRLMRIFGCSHPRELVAWRSRNGGRWRWHGKGAGGVWNFDHQIGAREAVDAGLPTRALSNAGNLRPCLARENTGHECKPQLDDRQIEFEGSENWRSMPPKLCGRTPGDLVRRRVFPSSRRDRASEPFKPKRSRERRRIDQTRSVAAK